MKRIIIIAVGIVVVILVSIVVFSGMSNTNWSTEFGADITSGTFAFDIIINYKDGTSESLKDFADQKSNPFTVFPDDGGVEIMSFTYELTAGAEGELYDNCEFDLSNFDLSVSTVDSTPGGGHELSYTPSSSYRSQLQPITSIPVYHPTVGITSQIIFSDTFMMEQATIDKTSYYPAGFYTVKWTPTGIIKFRGTHINSEDPDSSWFNAELPGEITYRTEIIWGSVSMALDGDITVNYS